MSVADPHPLRRRSRPSATSPVRGPQRRGCYPGCRYRGYGDSGSSLIDRRRRSMLALRRGSERIVGLRSGRPTLWRVGSRRCRHWGVVWPSLVELVTERLVLRPPKASDADDALALLQDPEVVRWNPGGDVVDHDSALRWCRSGADWCN